MIQNHKYLLNSEVQQNYHLLKNSITVAQQSIGKNKIAETCEYNKVSAIGLSAIHTPTLSPIHSDSKTEGLGR